MFLAVFAFALALVDAEGPSARIIAGSPVAVIISLSNNRQSLCGGSIVGNGRYVITAGHCLKSLSTGAYMIPDKMTILAGVDRSRPSQTRTVTRFWVEPSYDANVASSNRIDLGIIEVSSAFTINSAVTTITLCANDNSCGAAGVPLIVSGFGQTISDSSDSTSTTLNYASLRSVSASACALKFATNFGCSNCLPATNVCAESDVLSDPSKDSCFGDSGGPLVQNFNQASPVWRLYGVVSSGTVPAGQTPSCGKPGEYGLYVSIGPNRVWIDSVMAGNQNSSAVTSQCVASGTCQEFTPNNNPFFSFSSWPYWAWIIIGVGAFLIILAIVICCVACNK